MIRLMLLAGCALLSSPALGQDRDPLSGVFLIPLGLPWIWLGDAAGLTGPALAILAPAINAGILYWVWKR